MRKATFLIAAMFMAVGAFAQNVTLTVNVDMSPAMQVTSTVVFSQTSNTVYISGDFTTPTWITPGSDATLKMTQVGETNIYTYTIEIPSTTEGDTVLFKCFFTNENNDPDWNYGYEWQGDPNRTIVMYDYNVVTNIVWGNPITVDVKDSKAVAFKVYPNPFNSTLTLSNLENVNRIMISNVIGQTVMTITNVENTMNISTADLKTGIYMVTVIDNNNNRRTERVIKY